MEVKPGYRESEVGVIPEDWGVVLLGELLATTPDYGINAPAIPFDSRHPTYLRITDISDDGRFVHESKTSVDHPLATHYLVHDGDIVFARTGASVGKSYRYDHRDGELVFAGFLIRVRPDTRVLNPSYLKHYAQSSAFQEWVAVNSTRTGQPGINGREYASLPVPLPPTKAEQQAISEALSDADALIESVEQLIAKKRHLKHGAMQILLTGKKRLPGFSEEWEAKRLGEIGWFAKGKGIKKDEVRTDGVPCIRYGEIYTCHRDYIREFRSFISRSITEQSQRLHAGDLLFAGSGETAEEIGKCVAFLGEEEAYAGGDIVILSPLGQNSLFLGYLMNHASVCSQKARLGQGDAVVHISAGNLAKLKVRLPKLAEQTAIATILFDMDAEIVAQEAKLAKARLIKQGMMQELLTGKTRLI